MISVPAFAAGARIVRGGLAALAYDECEYAWQMLAIVDSLVRRGLLAWPEVMALHQRSAKPPLLVDVAAAFSLLLGPARPPYAIAATMAVTNAITAIVVFRLARDLFSPRAAVAALLALGAIPAPAFYSAKLFPEPLVTLLLFVLVANLFSTRPRSPVWRALTLGATIGEASSRRRRSRLSRRGRSPSAGLRARDSGPMPRRSGEVCWRAA